MEKESKPKIKEKFFHGLGRRKRATARVWLFDKKTETNPFTVNEMPIEAYFLGERAKEAYLEPFFTVGISHPLARFTATMKVTGGGKEAQIEAATLAFARSLVDFNETFRPLLSTKGLLRRDPREVERKKPYLRKARKAPQYSKR
ncbi:30S ribosomal protein S9 [candidate division WWE3 bacterium CG_4_10_14_0_2_um_filter_42_7]|uniref:30S ribosomal protein S9 n=2 Tax=Katanobacteria TaxID=422282 RepID=A0A2H0X8U1_UNCKA|nr:MAG: 30S ribosomal protein S9 [candidate division WWE3 bacterium CG08_land_8_20_14_0_20_41_15]PIZ43827.1 MAG: 30S ribosomal protein S9 [candidate division WWE3 bacterium CG_4_10_14_0_2_um_filter_42_7]